MHRALSGNGSRRAVVLHGLGGMGKTQLAVAYAKRHRDSYSAIFWVNVKDDDAVKQSFTRIARQILREYPLSDRLSRVSEENANEVVDAVKAWLSLRGNTRWLMVYDNYDTPKLPNSIDAAAVDIQSYLPESYQGSVIITTRSSRVDLGHVIKITKLDDIKDGVKILSNMSRRGELSTGKTVHIDWFSVLIRPDPAVIRLARELDGLPLALATAGAYLYQAAITCSDYLRLYKASWLKLQQTSPGLNSYEDRMLYSTWQISFDRVRQQNELSAMLLRLWAYFDSRDLWFELVRHSDTEDPIWMQQLEDELTFNAAIRVLIDHGLIDAENRSQDQIESKGYSMHSCVHSWTMHVLNRTWDYDMAKLSLKCIASHVPRKETAGWWLTQRRLLQHATRCTDLLEGLTMDRKMARLCHSLGHLYEDQGKLREAGEMYQRALQVKEKELGPEHRSTLKTINSLGILYIEQGKLREAEEMFQRALQVKEKELGLEHRSTLKTINSLGILYIEQGKLCEAEEMFQRALQAKEKELGLEHSLILETISSLGILYRKQGKLREAEEIFQRVLQAKEKELGPEHRSTLETINSLGNLYIKQGKLREAEEMFQRVLQAKEELGPEHRSTLETINSLGILYRKQGKLREAEEMFKRVLQAKEKELSPEHRSTLKTINSLGNLYMKQGKLREAEKMYQRVLQGLEKALGSDLAASHLPMLDTAYNMGRLFAQQGNIHGARTMYKRVLSGYQNVFGIDHPECQNVEDKLIAIENPLGTISSGRATQSIPIVPDTTAGTNTSTIRMIKYCEMF